MKKLLFLFCFLSITSFVYGNSEKVVISIYSKPYHKKLNNQAIEIEAIFKKILNKDICKYVPAKETIPMMRKFYKDVVPTAPYLYKKFEITPPFREWLANKGVDYLVMAGINYTKSKKMVLFYRVLPVINKEEDKAYLQAKNWTEMRGLIVDSLKNSNLLRDTNEFFDKQQQQNKGWYSENLPQGIIKSQIPGLYVWQKDNSIMVYVPKGKFLYKDKETVTQKETNGYYIDKYEVNNLQFCQFLNSANLNEEKIKSYIDLESEHCLIEKSDTYQPKLNSQHYPVVEVSYLGAYAYAQWAGKQLPSTDEWQKAFRGAEEIPVIKAKKISFVKNPYSERLFAWGEVLPDKYIYRCNFMQQNANDGYKWLAPTIAYEGLGDSPYHCSNMTGNVWEWCSTEVEQKFCQGGAWSSDMETLKNAIIELDHDKMYNDVGFRNILRTE